MRLLLHFICMAGTGIIISAEDAENHSSMMTSRECYAVTAVRIWYFLRYVRLLLLQLQIRTEFFLLNMREELIGIMRLLPDSLRLVKQQRKL